jgi:hypothetical protein
MVLMCMALRTEDIIEKKLKEFNPEKDDLMIFVGRVNEKQSAFTLILREVHAGRRYQGSDQAQEGKRR